MKKIIVLFSLVFATYLAVESAATESQLPGRAVAMEAAAELTGGGCGTWAASTQCGSQSGCRGIARGVFSNGDGSRKVSGWSCWITCWLSKRSEDCNGG